MGGRPPSGYCYIPADNRTFLRLLYLVYPRCHRLTTIQTASYLPSRCRSQSNGRHRKTWGDRIVRSVPSTVSLKHICGTSEHRRDRTLPCKRTRKHQALRCLTYPARSTISEDPETGPIRGLRFVQIPTSRTTDEKKTRARQGVTSS